jgi:hypothetical protein
MPGRGHAGRRFRLTGRHISSQVRLNPGLRQGHPQPNAILTEPNPYRRPNESSNGHLSSPRQIDADWALQKKQTACGEHHNDALETL